MHRGMAGLSPSSYVQHSNWLFRESLGANWTPEENKQFENALALYDKDTPDRWARVAAMIPGKTEGDVIKQYNELLEDVSDIEAGLIPVPGYRTDSFTLEWVNNHGYDGASQFYTPGGKRLAASRPPEPERKKGVPWTEEEHRQFLMGLQKYGKGDWRNISRNFVTTRTPTQVASHAQKYFIRQSTGGKDKRRSSIHDITTATIPSMKSSSTETLHKDRASVRTWKHHNEETQAMNHSGGHSYRATASHHGYPAASGQQNMYGSSYQGYHYGSPMVYQMHRQN